MGAKIKTKVQLTIEIEEENDKFFGDDWKMENIKRIVLRKAVNKMNRIIGNSSGTFIVPEKSKIVSLTYKEYEN